MTPTPKVFSYYLFYKPYLTLCQFTKEQPSDTTLADFLTVEKDVYPIGRLDKDSEGLLLLSNDPQLNQRWLHPKHNIAKTYLAQVEGTPTAAHIKALANGVTISLSSGAYRTQPAQVHLLPTEPALPPRYPPIRYRAAIPTHWLSITITEGKNRQVRKMCAAVGLPVLRLVRTHIGNLTIGNLQSGEYQKIANPLR